MAWLVRIVAALLCAGCIVAQTPPTGDWWLNHFTRDLLPFWDSPQALGDPVGAFPSTRCNDGTAIDFQAPCPEVNNPYLLTPSRYLVPMSRQVYGYGVAFHLTGDPKYLGYMKAGVDAIRTQWIDREHGGFFETQSLTDGSFDSHPEWRDPQQLGYGLLGLAMYYYLTRDPDVLPDLLWLKRYILENYYNPGIGTMQWLLADHSPDRREDKHLVATLDQMNTYLVLLAPILPEPARSEWQGTLRVLAHSIIDTYYSPKDNLMFLSATTASDKDITVSTPDFGHSAKAMWMIRFTGLMTGDTELVAFTESHAPALLERAYIAACGCWGGGVVKGGGMDPNKSWWVYAELDQIAGTLAINGLDTGKYLARTTAYWQENFVDHRYGEVWTSLDAATNQPPIGDLPKQWQWKNAYHSFEHALVGYITGQQANGQPVRLYYAFRDPAGSGPVRPYYFTGTPTQFRPAFRDGMLVYEATFSGVK